MSIPFRRSQLKFTERKTAMNEYIVILKDGSEITIFAYTHEGAVQEAKERGHKPSHAELA